MDARLEIARLQEEAMRAKPGMRRIETLVAALSRYINVLDDELGKIRQELQSRNGGENG